MTAVFQHESGIPGNYPGKAKRGFAKLAASGTQLDFPQFEKASALGWTVSNNRGEIGGACKLYRLDKRATRFWVGNAVHAAAAWRPQPAATSKSSPRPEHRPPYKA